MPEVILDAELVWLDATGRPDFARLRRRLVTHTIAAVERAAAVDPVTLMVYDVLWHEGHDARRRCYDDRRAVLEPLALEGPSWRTPPRFCAARDDLAAVTRERQLEGVVAKRRDAPYEPGRRSGVWVKFKHWRRERLQAIAWLLAHGASGRDGLLVARADEHGRLTPAGVVQLGGRPRSTIVEGVEATVRLVELDGVTGRYFDGTEESRANPQAYDPEARRRLWEVSEALTEA